MYFKKIYIYMRCLCVFDIEISMILIRMALLAYLFWDVTCVS